MSSIQHIAELFNFDERDFITAAYRTLLGRKPDPIGMNYYLGRLRMGYGKAAIIVQLATSKEAYPLSKVSGLASLIKEEQHANHWFIGLFNRHQRTERLIRQVSDDIGRNLTKAMKINTIKKKPVINIEANQNKLTIEDLVTISKGMQ
jgi:hypothetical protein